MLARECNVGLHTHLAENNDDVDMNEIKPLINNKKEKDDYDY